MKRWLLVALLILSPVLRGATVSPAYGGGLALESAGVMLVVRAIAPGWFGYDGMGWLKSSDSDAVSFRVRVGWNGSATPEFAGKLALREKRGYVVARYELVPDRDCELNQLCLTSTFPFDVYGGGRIVSGDESATIPVERRKTHFFSSVTRKLVIKDADLRQRLVLVFNRPVKVAFQDNREWGSSTMSMRIHLSSDCLFRKGETYALEVAVQDGTASSLSCEGVTIRGGTDWIPVRSESKIRDGSALDFSSLRGERGMAGRYGYPIAKGDHFEFEKLPGVPQRFYGVNICDTANLPDREAARDFARHLAKIGYNAVRIHHHEYRLLGRDGMSLDQEKMKRLDGLMAACIENGLYLTTDLYVSRRPITYRSIGVEKDGEISPKEFKEWVLVHEGSYSNYLNFARAFLGHVNPYTGRSLAQEPALGWLSLINEGNLGNHGTEMMRRIPSYQEKWRKWLLSRQKENPEFYEGIPETIPERLVPQGSKHVQAYTLFMRDLERSFVRRTKTFLHDEMKCRALLTNMNAWHYPLVYESVREAEYDYVDEHFYVDHPQFLDRRWQLPSYCPNANPVRRAGGGGFDLAWRRHFGKPFVVSEYNYSGPGRFRGLGGLMFGSFAARQDWSGLWRFAWSHSIDGVVCPEKTVMNYFDIAGDPLTRASERASICLFLRCDLEPLRHSRGIALSRDGLNRQDCRMAIPSDQDKVEWTAKVGLAMDKAVQEATNGAVESSSVIIDRDTGCFVVKTPRTCGGFAERGIIDAGALRADVGLTAATVWVSALDGQSIESSDRLLLTHLTDVQNSGTTYADAAQTVLTDWGCLPQLMRRGTIRAVVRLHPGPWKVFAITSDGTRHHAVPSSYTIDGIRFLSDNGADASEAIYQYELVCDKYSHE